MSIERIIRTKDEIADGQSRLAGLRREHLIRNLGFKVWAEAALDRDAPHKVESVYIKWGDSESLAENRVRLRRQELDALVKFYSDLMALEGTQEAG